ncbi:MULTISPECIES: 2OG-Fe(II) oxygenase [unclassified Gordonia (in: high G+C Gram-positive bacteria)]|uniref:2OG-Fe(II) oxygenase n=1 Tax=Gordonia TaxID=2053 RepID=UPI0010F5DD08|nr:MULTISPECIES: 2OG-Fe(II) oxygenase [unclassified Gordonia (in: high G+C Gram-positive bacteria)]MBR7194299.1 2OG-Fe(II) oxygenase [Gordonia sp. SCSIO 19800]MDT0221939.1 2OG-Fe(II) oxygenase [Gordonia sp. AC31]
MRTDRASDDIWTELADLDVRPERALGVLDLLSGRIRGSFRTLAQSLEVPFPELSRTIFEVLEMAPHVVGYGAGYIWMTSVHSAIRVDDTNRFEELAADFERFRAAAAVLSGSSYVADGFRTDLLSRGAEGGPVVSLPSIGAFELNSDSGLRIESGIVHGEYRSGPRTGGLRVDAFESAYRLPRSKSLFDLAPEGCWETAHEEIIAAADMAHQLVPTLMDRYQADVVPLKRGEHTSNAGTDEAAPFVLYSSFRRTPVDLVACLAHEEAHALMNAAEKILGGVLPESELTMPVPWKPGVTRTLSDVIHGLISFGRAAQVRGRALSLGVSDEQNEEARERESRWVREVTAGLENGVLGPLSDELRSWLGQNVERLEPAPPEARDGRDVVAVAGDSTDACPWVLYRSTGTRNAAAEQYPELSQGEWLRGSGAFGDQDRRDLEVVVKSRLDTVLTQEIPELIQSRFGTNVVLEAVKAHRLREGDSIRNHSDHDDRAGSSSTGSYRAVLGCTVAPTAGGELRFTDGDREAFVGLPLRFGDALIMNIDVPGGHEVTKVSSNTFRYTIIATYRRDGDA